MASDWPRTFLQPGCFCLATYIRMYKYVLYTYIKAHDSELRGQEEAGRTRRTSELFTHSTALKFVNALNKPP